MKTKSKSAARSAVFICAAFGILCPECGESQPAADGSEIWTPEDLETAPVKLTCVACDCVMKLARHSTARIEA